VKNNGEQVGNGVSDILADASDSTVHNSLRICPRALPWQWWLWRWHWRLRLFHVFAVTLYPFL